MKRREDKRSRAPVPKKLRQFEDMLEEQVGRALGSRESSRLWERHVAPSLALSEHAPAHGGWMADVGSGAGLPGIPLAITRPDLCVVLIEPRAERVRWLRAALDRLELTNALVEQARWAHATPRRYDMAVARAVAPPDAALRLLRSGPPAARLVGSALGDPEPPWTVVDQAIP